MLIATNLGSSEDVFCDGTGCRVRNSNNIMLLQNALNRFAGTLRFRPLVVDGVVGTNTIDAFLIVKSAVMSSLIAPVPMLAIPGAIADGISGFTIFSNDQLGWRTLAAQANAAYSLLNQLADANGVSAGVPSRPVQAGGPPGLPGTVPPAPGPDVIDIHEKAPKDGIPTWAWLLGGAVLLFGGAYYYREHMS